MPGFTTIKIKIVFCDGCGSSWGTESHDGMPTHSDAMADARAMGWATRQGEFLCAGCLPDGTEA